MTRQDIVGVIANHTGGTLTSCEGAYKALINLLAAELVSQKQAVIPGLGTLVVAEQAARPERTGRNPRTGEAIPIGARRVVTFHASHKLKEQIQG